MKINGKVLSIPPYISTAWTNISAMHMEGSTLKITLKNGSIIDVPALNNDMLGRIFAAHAEHIESEAPAKERVGASPFSMPVMDIDEGNLAQFTGMMQHNPDQADSPDLPKAMLDKVGELSKALGMEEDMMPKGEPHCNCPFCQISRAVHGIEKEAALVEEEVSDEDLHFRDWEIEQKGENLYVVTNPLNAKEHYQVFLGEPVGCTCGQSDCEHIYTVLKS